jgi:hypothetical protein
MALYSQIRADRQEAVVNYIAAIIAVHVWQALRYYMHGMKCPSAVNYIRYRLIKNRHLIMTILRIVVLRLTTVAREVTASATVSSDQGTAPSSIC